MKITFRAARLASFVALVLASAHAAPAQTWYSSMNDFDTRRGVQVREVYFDDAPTTNTAATLVEQAINFTGTPAASYSLTPFCGARGAGGRSLAVQFTEASGSSARLTVTLRGETTLSATSAAETLSFTSNGILYTKNHFAGPVTVTVDSSTAIASGDTLTFFPMGIDFPHSLARSAQPTTGTSVLPGQVLAIQKNTGLLDQNDLVVPVPNPLSTDTDGGVRRLSTTANIWVLNPTYATLEFNNYGAEPEIVDGTSIWFVVKPEGRDTTPGGTITNSQSE